MRRRILRRIAELSFRFAGLLFVILLLVTLLASQGMKRLRLDTGLSDFLPPNSPIARLISGTVHDYRNLEPILVTLRAEKGTSQSDLIEMGEEFARLAGDQAWFTRTVYKRDELAQEYYESLSDVRLFSLMTEADWDYLHQLMQSPVSRHQFASERARRLSAMVPPRIAEMSGDPLGLLDAVRERISRTRAPIPINLRRGYFFSPDGQSLQLLLYPVKSADDGLHALRTTQFLESARDFLIERNPEWRYAVAFEFSGSHIEIAEKLRSLGHDLAVIGGFSLAFVLLLIIMIYRKVEAVAFILIPPAIGTIWALGLAHAWCWWTGTNTTMELGVSYTNMTGITLAFLLLAFGLGLNYSLLIFNRFTIELYKSGNHYRALQTAYVETGRGVMTSALIAALIFFSIFLTSFRGLKELGVLAGVATLCNLASTLLVVPTFAALKHWLARGQVNPVRLYRINLVRWCAPALQLPRATIGALLLLTVFFVVDFESDGIHAVSLKFHPRFASMAAYFFRENQPEERVAEADASEITRPGRPLVALVEAPTLEEALQRNDQLYDRLLAAREEDQLGILAIESLRVTLPSVQTQLRSIEHLKTLDLSALNESIALASWDAGFKPTVFKNLLQTLATMQAHVADPAQQDYLIQFDLTSDPVFMRAVQRLVTHVDNTYRVATPIYPRAEGFSRDQITLLTSFANPDGAGVNFVGDPMIEREISERLKYDLAVVFMLASAAVFLCLVLHFRGFRPALIAFGCVVAQGLWLMGLMSLAGVPLHMLTLMAIPIVITMAVDHAIHILQHYRDRRSLDVRIALLSTGRAVLLSGVLSLLLYGTLSLIDVEGMRHLGLVMVFGAASNLIGSLLLLPAAIRVWGRSQPLLSVLRPARLLE